MLSFEKNAKQKSERFNSRFKLYCTVIALAQLFRVTSGKSCSNSDEVITFDPCTSIANQQYVVGASKVSATNIFNITSNGKLCKNENIQLDYIVVNPVVNIFEADWSDGDNSKVAKELVEWETD